MTQLTASGNAGALSLAPNSRILAPVARRKHSDHLSTAYLTLMNGTPYNWQRNYSHSYQMVGWKQESPLSVKAGEAVQFLIQPSEGLFDRSTDSAGELVYHLEGTSTPMAFELKYRHNKQKYRWEAQITFRGDLMSSQAKKGATTMIGNSHTWFVPPSLPGAYGGTAFLLAGTETDGFISTTGVDKADGDAGWMHNMLPQIGQKSLREVIVPRSHHAALNVANSTRLGVLGIEKYAVTQTRSLAEQLRRDGVRVLDTRVAKIYPRAHRNSSFPDALFAEFHGIKSDAGLQGMAGDTLPHIIDAINHFNEEYPGELIIWEFHQETFVHDGRVSSSLATAITRDLDDQERMEVFDMLKRNLKHRVDLPAIAEGVDDYTQIPLERFIGDGKSAVLVIFADGWMHAVSEKGIPFAKEGMITRSKFPYTGQWADTDQIAKMTRNQLTQLKRLRLQPKDKLFDLQWILSMGPSTFLRMSGKDLITMARQSMVEFRKWVWMYMTTERYPNWVTLDGLENGEMKTWAMAANLCFVARKCGDWALAPRSDMKGGS
ncbi:uncharacterized protein F5Z01DRAFT_663639 [Emericellopsis atlantica]|uniref:Uncharacterized protein n=1 Tax=Emericellopsis atlantica TaxID=2614577 RepID=A0A9P8CN04_9HYPO|nr:uncharacterized protein F5Z01DRAFT_663639 [Emericellopsis atlantica]KAG9251236.1 hypothetical protein F5Z01DRAFT_663639 [Emericellopsis atlantica]